MDGAADHDRTGVMVLAEGIEQHSGETEVALHELLRILRTVDTGKVEDEGAVLTPSVQLLGSGINVVFIDGFDRLREVVPLCLAFLYVIKLSTEILTYEPLCSCY